MRVLKKIGIIAVIVFAADLWMCLWGAGTIEFGLWPVAQGYKLPPGLLPIIGVLLGSGLTALILLPRIWSLKDAAATPPPVDQNTLPGPNFDRLSLLAGIAEGTVALMLILAVRSSLVTPLIAALILICGTLTAIACTHAFRALARGDSVEINSYWGGLGGGQGGWRLSPVTTLLLVALILLGATVTVATGYGHEGPVAKKNGTSTSNETADAGQEDSNAADAAR